VLPRTVCKREITRDEAIAYITNKRTEQLTDFTSRYGRPFAATLFLKENGRHGFEFAPRGGARKEGADGEAAPARKKKATSKKTSRKAGTARKKAAAKTATATTKKPARKTAAKKTATKKTSAKKAPKNAPKASGETS